MSTNVQVRGGATQEAVVEEYENLVPALQRAPTAKELFVSPDRMAKGKEWLAT